MTPHSYKKLLSHLSQLPNEQGQELKRCSKQYFKLLRFAKEQLHALEDKKSRSIIEEVWYRELKNILD